MPTICCLHKCVNLEELYLEKADSSGITSYLLAHILKFLIRLRVLALPKQCDDDVASVIGLNCPKLECIILTGTSVTNQGLSWLLCCRQLHTVLFHSLELLSSNHLELVSKLCPNVEWLSLDSALFYNLEGLNRLPQLRLLRLNYKGRPIDDTVIDFFKISCEQLTTLHLFDVKELGIEDLRLTIGQCPQLEVLVFQDCSVLPDWRTNQTKVISRSVD